MLAVVSGVSAARFLFNLTDIKFTDDQDDGYPAVTGLQLVVTQLMRLDPSGP